MRTWATVTALLMLCSAAIAQDDRVRAAIYDLESRPLTPIETIALGSFIAQWDEAALAGFPQATLQTVDSHPLQGQSQFASGLSQFRDAAQSASFNRDLDGDIAVVLGQADGQNLPIGSLSDEDATRLFVAAQAMNFAARAMAGRPQTEYCIFIIYCSDDGP